MSSSSHLWRIFSVSFTVILSIFVVVIAIIIGIVLEPEIDNRDDPFVLTKDSQLTPRIRQWKSKGKYFKVNGFKMFVRVHQQQQQQQLGGEISGDKNDNHRDEKLSNSQDVFTLHDPSVPPIILIHGFPSSSYEFHRVINPLLKYSREYSPSSSSLTNNQQQKQKIITFDLVGFGFSSKPPQSEFSYSMMDHADQVLNLLDALNISIATSGGAHFVSHDMGDSVLSEIITRASRGLLPDRFSSLSSSSFFRSVIFTNGGMVYRHINARISQTLLSMPAPIGPSLNKIMNRLDPAGKFFSTQLRTIWGQLLTDPEEMNQDIADLIMISHWNGGHKLMSALIRYLPERRLFDESRWLPSLKPFFSSSSSSSLVDDKKKETRVIRCAIIWGDADAVAPVAIAKSVYEEWMGNPLKGRCELIWMKNRGHFIQLEDPEIWAANVAKVIFK